MADELRLSIEKLIYGGDGLAHADGNTVFVPYVLPGEEVRANAKSKKKKLIWTELLEVISRGSAASRGKARSWSMQRNRMAIATARNGRCEAGCPGRWDIFCRRAP